MTAKRCNQSVTQKVFTIAFALPVIALSAILLLRSVQAENRKNLVFNGDFESGNFKGWNTSEGCCDHSHAIITSPVRSGSFAYRSLLKPTDKERAEIKLPPFPSNSERWIRVSIYIPSGFSTQGMCLFQLARKPGNGRYYNASFQLLSEKGRLKIKRYWKGTETLAKKHQTWELGAFEYDKWIDFVYHYKGSSASDGVFEVWMDGVQKVDYKGPTEHQRDQGPFIKFGVYVGLDNRIEKETKVYYDEFRIGDENSRYEDMALSTSQLSAPQQKIFEDFSSDSNFIVKRGGYYTELR